MYHAIVHRKITALFTAINAGDAEPLLQGFAPKFEHIMLGEGHSMAGRRRNLATARAWYARLFRLLPDIKFTITRVTIRGMPWNTLATVEWRETNFGTDGIRTHATGVHIAEIAWGRVTRLVILPDMVMLKATLDRLALAGHSEAAAPPIEDVPGWPD